MTETLQLWFSSIYLAKRNREILPISVGIYVLVIGANIAIAVITFANNWYDYLLQMMLSRILSILLHWILIFISCKYPGKLVQIHGPLVVLFQLPMILWATGHTSLPLNAMPASIAGLNSLIIYSIICNANWMVTTGILVVSLAGSFVYYCLNEKLRHPSSGSVDALQTCQPLSLLVPLGFFHVVLLP